MHEFNFFVLENVERINDKIGHKGWYYFGTMLRKEKPRYNEVCCMDTNIRIYNEEKNTILNNGKYLV